MNGLWAFGYPATALALSSGFSPSLVVVIRLIVAFMVFSPLLRKIRTWSWRLLWFSLAMGIVGFTLPLWLQTIGLHRTDPAIAAISVSLEPLLTIVIGALWMGSAIARWQKFALILALGGSWILTGEPRPGHLSQGWGDVALISAVLCFALYNVLSPKLTQWVEAGPAASLSFGFGAIGSLIVWGLSGTPLPRHLTPTALGALTFLSLGVTALAYFLWLYAVGRRSLTFAALFLYLQPLLGTITSWLLGQSRLTWSLVVGGVLVILAMTIGQETQPFVRLRKKAS